MNSQRRVKLWRHGRNRTVRIPLVFELPCRDVIVHREGDRLVVEPAGPKSLLAVLGSLEPLHEEFPPMLDTQPKPVEF